MVLLGHDDARDLPGSALGPPGLKSQWLGGNI